MVPIAKPVEVPASEPVSLEEARLWCRVDAEGSPPAHADDDILSALITRARETVEEYTGRSICAKVYEIRYDEWPDEVELPYSPVIEVQSVIYVDSSGGSTLMDPADYVVDTHGEPARIATVAGADWPTLDETIGAVRIRYRAGYDAAGSPNTMPVPKMLLQAMQLMIADWYRNREDTVEKELLPIPMGARFLMDFHKIRRGLA
jgi:uncharacterized phiE125 gp8 family phage protein